MARSLLSTKSNYPLNPFSDSSIRFLLQKKYPLQLTTNPVALGQFMVGGGTVVTNPPARQLRDDDVRVIAIAACHNAIRCSGLRKRGFSGKSWQVHFPSPPSHSSRCGCSGIQRGVLVSRGQPVRRHLVTSTRCELSKKASWTVAKRVKKLRRPFNSTEAVAGQTGQTQRPRPKTIPLATIENLIAVPAKRDCRNDGICS